MKISLQCPVCGTPYEADQTRLKYGRQTTCSRKCSYTLRRQNLTTASIYPCAACGTPTPRPPSRVKSKTNLVFCSPECSYKARTTGLVTRTVTKPYIITDEIRGQQSERMKQRNKTRKDADAYACSEETKAKISISVAKAIAQGRFPRVSALEKCVGVILNDMGVPNVPQYVIRDPKGRFGAVIDFYIPNQNLALEVNGTLWHTDPRIYPSGPQHPSQIRTASRYKHKMDMLKALGIPVIELWETDFNADPIGSVRSLLKI